MGILNMLRHNADKQIKADNMKPVNRRLAANQESVYRALEAQTRPINGLALAHLMGWDSACVTNRLAELVKKERVTIAYRKKGLDGKWRNFYKVTPRNTREFDSDH